jgi:hypothetical protein
MDIRLYIDEDSMRLALVRALQARGVDVTTALAEGMIEKTDLEQLLYATQQGRVLYSFNVGDFFQLHTEFLTRGRYHAGIILARQQQYSVGAEMSRLLKLIAANSAEDMQNRIEFLSDWS